MAKGDPLPVLADTREERSGVPQLLKGLNFAPVHTQTLIAGDYIWDSKLGLVILERKELGNLLSSLGSGELHRQLTRLIELARLPILLIEGVMEQYNGNLSQWRGGKPDTTWDYNAVQNALLSWQAAGVYVTYSPSTSYTPMRIASLYQWSQKEKHLKPKRERRITVIDRLSKRADVLAGLPRIGESLATALAAQGSLLDWFSAPIEDWEKAVGNKTGREVAAFIRERP